MVFRLVQMLQDGYSELGPIFNQLSHDILRELYELNWLDLLHPYPKGGKGRIFCSFLFVIAVAIGGLFLLGVGGHEIEGNSYESIMRDAFEVKQYFQQLQKPLKGNSQLVNYVGNKNYEKVFIQLLFEIQYINSKMRQKQEEVPNESNYQQQNKRLREIYLERMNSKKVQQDEPSQSFFQPQIKTNNLVGTVVSQNIQKQAQAHSKSYKQTHNLVLNTLFFDMRQSKPKQFVKLFSFFNQDIHNPKYPVSPDVQSIFITTFGFQVDTFEKILTSSKAKLVILNDSDQKTDRIIPNYSGFPNFTVILKAKNLGHRYGVFHMKLWLVKFKQFLRIVVCTSNQHTMDWAVWENAYWYQDFKKGESIGEDQKEGKDIKKEFDYCKDFKQTLDIVLNSIISKEKLKELTGISLDNYKFENINVVLIPSIPGRYTGENMKKQGLIKLQNVMRTFNQFKEPTLTYNSTSLGIIQLQFLQKIYASSCPNSKPFNLNKYRLIYPTKKYVQQETGGQVSVLFLTTENFKKSDVSTKVFYRFDSNPLNPILGCIPHLKTIFIQSSQSEKGILYVGSHNMTKAAWGKLQKQNSQLYIANSELGVLFPEVEVEWFKKWSPFKYPPQPYSSTDEPFFRQFLK